MPSEQLLHVRPVALRHRFQACDCLASPDDREALASVLDGVEEVGEAPCRIGRCDLGHPIRLSDPPRSGRHQRQIWDAYGMEASRY